MAITLRLPSKEDEILTKYAAMTGRTKTDVLREFIRSLEGEVEFAHLPANKTFFDFINSDSAEEQLPDKWYKRGDGGIVGNYRGADILMTIDDLGAFWCADIFFPGYGVSFQRMCPSRQSRAIAYFKKCIDLELEKQGLASAYDRH